MEQLGQRARRLVVRQLREELAGRGSDDELFADERSDGKALLYQGSGRGGARRGEARTVSKTGPQIDARAGASQRGDAPPDASLALDDEDMASGEPGSRRQARDARADHHHVVSLGHRAPHTTTSTPHRTVPYRTAPSPTPAPLVRQTPLPLPLRASGAR